MVYKIKMRKTVVDPAERAIRLGLLYDVLTQNAAAHGEMDSEAHKPAATAERQATEVTRPNDSTPMPGNHKKQK